MDATCPSHWPLVQDRLRVLKCRDQGNFIMHSLFQLIQTCKMMPLESFLQSWEEPKIVRREVRRVGWMLQDPHPSEEQVQSCGPSGVCTGVVHVQHPRLSWAWSAVAQSLLEVTQNTDEHRRGHSLVAEHLTVDHATMVKKCYQKDFASCAGQSGLGRACSSGGQPFTALSPGGRIILVDPCLI